MNHPSPPEKMNACRRRASTYITPRFHRRGTPAGPDQSPTLKKTKTNPIYHPNSQKTQNKPNYHPANMRNKPNSTDRHHPNSQKMRNEPNSRIPTVPPPPVSAKQTQSVPTPARTTTQERKTNPIHHPTAQTNETNPIAALRPNYSRFTTHYSLFYKTNPIPAYQLSRQPLFQRNKPNLPHPHRPTDPITRNEPNPAKSRISPRSVRVQICETNPITSPLLLFSTTPLLPPPSPKMRNEPNLPPRTHRPTTQKHETNPICLTTKCPPPPISAKRTQFSTTNIHSTFYNLQSLRPIYPTAAKAINPPIASLVLKNNVVFLNLDGTNICNGAPAAKLCCRFQPNSLYCVFGLHRAATMVFQDPVY